MAQYTINDIARISGFSRGTVSRVLNHDKNVKAATRERIEQVIAELNYQPNAMARGLVNGKLDIVALIMGDVRNPFFSNITYYVQNIMRELGYMVVLFNSNFDEETERKNIRIAQKMNFRGIFLISSMANAAVSEEIRNSDCPIVLLHRIIKGFQGDFVVQDNFHAGYIVANHLIELGHNRIAFLKGQNNSASSVSRVEGFRSAMSNAMLPVEEEYLYDGDFTLERGYEIGREYVKSLEGKPKAVICGNDMMAIGFIEACRAANVSVPGDVSVASFDDIDMARLDSIQLTTVHQPVKEMCQKACQIMAARIAGNPMPISRVMLNPSLVVRKTTAHYVGG